VNFGLKIASGKSNFKYIFTKITNKFDKFSSNKNAYFSHQMGAGASAPRKYASMQQFQFTVTRKVTRYFL